MNMSQTFNSEGIVVPFTWVKVEGEVKDIKEGDKVTITGVSKGKGFTGVVKRWNFRMGPVTHGQSDRTRAPGSIGSTTTVSRVLKGKKMAGRHGNKTVTLRNRSVVVIEDNKIGLGGPIPGAFNSEVKIYLNNNKNEG